MIFRALKFSVIIVVLISCKVSLGQGTSDLEKKTFLISIFDGKRYYDLFEFLETQGEVKEGQDSTIILSERKLIDSKSICGLYVFSIAGSHQRSYLYFVNSEKHKEFVIDYTFDKVLLKLIEFFHENGHCLTEQDKIEYLSEFSIFLKYRRLEELSHGHMQVIEKD